MVPLLIRLVLASPPKLIILRHHLEMAFSPDRPNEPSRLLEKPTSVVAHGSGENKHVLLFRINPEFMKQTGHVRIA
jgi:hypothetical protein